MSLIGDALFNLMLNGVASFLVALAMVQLLGAVARPQRASLALAVMLLPFVKVLWDLRSGIPRDSFFWASEHGVVQRLGLFQVGFGLHRWGPTVEGHLLALHAAGRSPQSFADVLTRALRFRVSVYAASLLSFGALAVSLLKCGQRSWALLVSRRKTRAILAACPPSEWRRVGRRSVRIYVAHALLRVPFAGGLFEPYVVLPARLVERLTREEREAVIEHELGHVRHRDLALLVPLTLLCELLWFVPGVSWLFSRVRSLLEERADDCAVAAGIAPDVVVSALLSAAELSTAQDAPLLAMSRGRFALGARVRRLLAPEPARVGKPWLSFARGLLLIWLVLGTLQANACGNHP